MMCTISSYLKTEPVLFSSGCHRLVGVNSHSVNFMIRQIICYYTSNKLCENTCIRAAGTYEYGKHTRIKVDLSSVPVAIKRLLTKIESSRDQVIYSVNQNMLYSYLRQPFVSLRGSLQGTCTCLCLLIVYNISYVYVMG